MVSPTHEVLGKRDDWDEEDLSEEQIKTLLQRAEQRLSHSNAKHPENTIVGGRISQKTPKLNIGAIAQPYIASTEGVEKKATAGPDFFNMPRTNLTPELKSDLQLLKMRSILDPHQHYKKDNAKSLVPKYSQVGRIIEGPTEYFSSRLPNKERKKNFVEEVLANDKSRGRFKNKYNEIQASKTSGRKAHYKKLKEKRSGGIRKS
ncbi:hypothetical protein P7C71_g4709, partial [Lecanoromycetidae sp. Uapishka_2]